MRERQRLLLPFLVSRSIKLFPLFVALSLIAACAGVAPAQSAPSVGYAQVQIPNGEEPPLVAGIWYPASAHAEEHRLELVTQSVALEAPPVGHDLPLVVISDGGGGSLASHYDTALALARAGFVVAAVTHAGDTYDDQSRVLELWRRPAHLSRVITFLLDEWGEHERLDPDRIGAFGPGHREPSRAGRVSARRASVPVAGARFSRGANPAIAAARAMALKGGDK